MSQLLDTILLFSLPASGKSEVRRYLASLTPDQCRNDFHMGPTLQLDDYPYVHLMHRIDDELKANGLDYAYYRGSNRPFIDDWTWAVLIELLNEDYADLMASRQIEVPSAAQHLFDRLDAAHARVGLSQPLGEVPHRIRVRMAEVLEAECRAELDVLNRQNAQDKTGRTLVIEAARGGAHGSAFPLTPPHGYDSAFQTLSPDILEKAVVLYVWVDPAESRRKNIERGRPDGQGSILNHSVPMEVMLGQYGCDDMAWLMDAERPPRHHPRRAHHPGRRPLRDEGLPPPRGSFRQPEGPHHLRPGGSQTMEAVRCAGHPRRTESRLRSAERREMTDFSK